MIGPFEVIGFWGTIAPHATDARSDKNGKKRDFFTVLFADFSDT